MQRVRISILVLASLAFAGCGGTYASCLSGTCCHSSNGSRLTDADCCGSSNCLGNFTCR